MVKVVKNPPANAGDAGDTGSIPGLRIFLGEGNDNHSSILASRIPWTEEPGGYSPWNHSQTQLSAHTHTHTHTRWFSNGTSQAVHCVWNQH